MANGIKTTLVGRTRPLVLSGALTATVVTIRMVKRIHSEFSNATAQGEFVILRVKITNDTNKPQLFNCGTQTELDLGDKTFSTSSSGTIADSGTGFLEQIQPDEYATGDCVFDVPTVTLVASHPKHAGLLVVPFSDFVQFGTPSALGLILPV